MKKMELLAPAGTMEKMKMALLYGADAVYLAGKVFGLRAYGGNFSMEELKEAVSYAHSMGKKVYVTVNIIPRNEDLEGLDDYLKYLESIHVDAALISDLGVFSLCREVAPNLPIHVSTQASSANWRTVKAWKDMGAERVVLAREVSVKEMADIRKRWTSTWKSSATAPCAFPGPAAAFCPISLPMEKTVQPRRMHPGLPFPLRRHGRIPPGTVLAGGRRRTRHLRLQQQGPLHDRPYPRTYRRGRSLP